jgi:hypothetical protein
MGFFLSSLFLYISFLAGYHPLFGLAIMLITILQQKRILVLTNSYIVRVRRGKKLL